MQDQDYNKKPREARAPQWQRVTEACPLTWRVWMYIDRFPEGCWVPRTKIAEEMGAKPNSVGYAIRELLRLGLLREVTVTDRFKISRSTLTTNMGACDDQPPESWMGAATSPAPAPQQPPQRQEVPAPPAPKPVTATKSALSRWLDSTVESTTRRCLTAKRGTLIGALPEHSRVSTLAKALRKVPYIADVYELASEPTVTAMQTDEEALFIQVLDDAIAHLCGLSGEGANNPAAVLMKNASEFLVDEQAAARKVVTASTPAEPVLPFDPAFQGSDLLAAGADVDRKFVVQHRAQRVVLFQMLTASELAECRAQANARRARQLSGGPARWQLGQSEVFRLLARLRDSGDARLKTFSQYIKDADFQDCR